MKTIYTVGYSGKTPEGLQRAIEAVQGTLVDIRLSPRSRVPHWSRDGLCRLMAGRYLHLAWLGNLNYKTGGPITLQAPDRGINVILTMIEVGHTPVLLCGCKDPIGCHRSVVADLLRRDGFDVQELEVPGG